MVIGAGAALVEVRGDAGEEGKQPRLAKVDLEPAILAALPSAPSTAYSTAFSSRVHEGLIDAEYLRARHAILRAMVRRAGAKKRSNFRVRDFGRVFARAVVKHASRQSNAAC